MSDPPDILGDPGGLTGIASTWGNAAESILTLQTQIAQHGLDSWVGSSGGVYRVKLGEFHPHLGAVNTALQVAGDRIGTFARALDGYQTSAGSYRQQLSEKRQSLADTQSQHAGTSEQLSSAQAQHAASTDPVTAAKHQSLIDRLGDMLSGLERDISDLEHDIANLVSSFWDLFDRYVHDVEDCARVVEGEAERVAAILTGPAARALMSVVGGGLSGLVRDGERAVAGFARDVQRGAEDLAHDAVTYLDNHWQAIRHVLEITSLVVGIVGGIALSFVIGPEAGFLVAGLASTLVSEVQAGGDEFVARGGNPNPTTRNEARSEETADVIGAGVSLLLTVGPLSDVIGGVGDDLGGPLSDAIDGTDDTIKNLTPGTSVWRALTNGTLDRASFFTDVLYKADEGLAQSVAQKFLPSDPSTALRDVVDGAEPTEPVLTAPLSPFLGPALTTPFDVKIPLDVRKLRLRPIGIPLPSSNPLFA